MHRIPLPSRPDGDPGLASPAYTSNLDYWRESVGYEITASESNALKKAALEITACYSEALDFIVHRPEALRKFHFRDNTKLNETIQDISAESWRTPSERSYVLDRLDLAWDGINPPKLLERNFGYLGLIETTGVVQEEYVAWLAQQPGYSDVERFGDLKQKFKEAFRDVAHERGIPSGSDVTLIVGSENLGQHMLATNDILSDWITSAGFNSHQRSARKKVEFCTGQFFDIEVDLRTLLAADLKNPERERPAAAYPFYNFQDYVDDQAGSHGQRQTTTGLDCVVLQPSWALLMNHKAMLPVLHQLYPEHPNFLPAFDGDQGVVGQKSFIKHVDECQGFGAQIKAPDGTTLIKRHENPYMQKCKEENYITQAYCDAVSNPDGSYKVFHIFTANGQPAAIGVREGPTPFVGGADTCTRSLPVVVRNRPENHPVAG